MRLVALFSFSLLLLLTQCAPLPSSSTAASSKTLQLDNRSYEPTIKSVSLYPVSGERPALSAFLNPAVTALQDGVALQLEFDELTPDYNNYFLKIIHCNADWTKSGLRDLEFLADYNEFPINNWAYSSNTRTPYVHYQHRMPQVKLPGNYVAMVYRNGNTSDVVLTHRFMVTGKSVDIATQMERPQSMAHRDSHQRITVRVNYDGLDVQNPQTQIRVAVRQNRRWDITRTLTPTQNQVSRSTLVYAPFDEEADFPGWNEFRWFEMRNINAPGQNVRSINIATNRLDAMLVEEQSRGGLAYGQIPDLNGAVQPRIAEGYGAEQGEYLYTHFLLESDSLPGRVYTVGAYNHWKRDADSELVYNQQRGGYVGTQLLKQGWYNYLYYFEPLVSGPEAWELEGSHFATENIYEVMVYYRPLGSIQDLLVGYTLLEVNAQ